MKCSECRLSGTKCICMITPPCITVDDENFLLNKSKVIKMDIMDWLQWIESALRSIRIPQGWWLYSSEPSEAEAYELVYAELKKITENEPTRKWVNKEHALNEEGKPIFVGGKGGFDAIFSKIMNTKGADWAESGSNYEFDPDHIFRKAWKHWLLKQARYYIDNIEPFIGDAD